MSSCTATSLVESPGALAWRVARSMNGNTKIDNVEKVVSPASPCDRTLWTAAFSPASIASGVAPVPLSDEHAAHRKTAHSVTMRFMVLLQLRYGSPSSLAAAARGGRGTGGGAIRTQRVALVQLRYGSPSSLAAAARGGRG